MEHLDIKGITEKYVPHILDFVDLDALEFVIQKKLQKKYEARLLIHRGFNPYDDCDFYDLLFLTTKINDPETDQDLVFKLVSLLRCFEVLFKSLSDNLSKEEKLLIGKTVGKIFRNANNHYLHYIGELLVLNSLLTIGYKLNEADVKLGGLKDAEYLITDSRDGEQYLLEVINIRLFNTNPKHTRHKLQQKMNDKTKEGIDESRFYLQPIIWSEKISDIQQLAKNISLWDKFHIKNVFEPFALYMFQEQDGSPYWEFTRISRHVLKDEEELVTE